MSQFKHTPGPWTWNRYEFRDGFYGLYSGDIPVLYPQRENDGDDGDAWFSSDEGYYGETALKEADARLIAAAPKLLEILSALLDDIEGLMGESSGVYGLHLNGDPSPWGELTEGGRFERLLNISAARAVIANVAGEA